jgi:NAD(P)-dependent dehydrogenase (short-subunit alcohol dehydrogenase family)
MFEDLKGKTVLITGASSGLGAGFARIFSQYGARVAVAARRTEKLNALRDELAGQGTDVQVIEMDVTDLASIESGIAAVSPHVDILINNAGVASFGNSLKVSEAEWDKTLDTNLKGMFFTAQSVANRMVREERSGAIVNISSITALRPSHGLAAYSASKAGVSHLTKVLALDWARNGIRVNAICPGYFETEMSGDYFGSTAGQEMIARIPTKRIGQMEDLEGPVLLLASDAGRHITGVNLPVDGGHLLLSL